MTWTRRISGQLSDLVVYVLLPAFAVLSPAGLSRRLIRWVSGWDWILRDGALASLEGAGRHVDTGEADVWLRRWKQVELLDYRDLYMLLFGRAKAVLAEIDCPTPIETARDHVMVGMHWGPAISVLKLLGSNGLRPAFPYREPQRQLKRDRPFHYLASRLAERYLARTLADRAVAVGGAGQRLRTMLDEPGTICVLMDAPPVGGRRTISHPVLGRTARFHRGFPALMTERGKDYLLYAMNLSDDGSLRKRLELNGPHRATAAETFIADYAGFMDRHLGSDPACWRFWQFEGQLWSGAPTGGGRPAD